MLKLHVIQAQYGDCLLLVHGDAGARTYVLVDGGPQHVYDDDLKPILEGIREAGGRLAAVVVSHVDDDHIRGVLDLFKGVAWDRIRGLGEVIAFDELWHNSFSAAMGADVKLGIYRLLGRGVATREAMPRFSRVNRDIEQGDELTRVAEGLGVGVNQRFAPSHILCSDDLTGPVRLGELELRIVGPNRQDLENLKTDWLAWLAEQERAIAAAAPAEAVRAAEKADDRVPNLSSIMFLARADGKSLLLTGDGLSDHLLRGLGQAGLLNAEGKLHVNVLKLPHHGSKHNTTLEFLQAVTADHYVISASGRYGHPHLPTLRWLVETARDQGRSIKLWATNETASLKRLQQDHPPAAYGYQLQILETGQRALTLDLE
jgi:beta-lactamase superfamily II metal-dependent hydrolase